MHAATDLRRLAAFALLAALLVPGLAIEAQDRDARDRDAQKRERGEKSRVIGEVSKDGKRVRLHTDRLQTKMGKGLETEGFAVMRRGRELTLLRVGDHDGRTVVEGISLEVERGSLKVPRDVKWITTCFPAECNGFCVPADGHCDCYGESIAIDEFYVDDGWGDFLDVSTGIGNTGGGCTFGTMGGGLFDVVILH